MRTIISNTSSVPVPVVSPESYLFEEDKVPQHVAIIMDGNGRWAAKRGLSRLQGHRQGVEAVRRTLAAAREFNVKYLTIWAFSSENWDRPPAEVKGILDLIHYHLTSELSKLNKEGIRLRFIGQRHRFSPSFASLLNYAEELTATNDQFHLTIALSYGGRDDIVRSARELAYLVQAGKITPDQINEDLFSQYLSTSDLPDPDLLIRTSGEKRVSNFLLWQQSYTEFVFLDKLWPEFDKADFALALKDYQRRHRRYGKVSV